MPAQPMSEVTTPKHDAMSDTEMKLGLCCGRRVPNLQDSSTELPTLTTSAWCQILKRVNKQKIKATSE